MPDYIWYIAKVSICIIAFYAFYALLFKNSTYLIINRLYLIAGLILSFTIPLLKMSIFDAHSIGVFSSIPQLMNEPEYSQFHNFKISETNENRVNIPFILSVIYFAGVMVLFTKLFLSILRLVRSKNNSQSFIQGKIKIVKVKALVPFSFFNMVFLPEHENNPLIIEHEIAHIRQLHWFDLIIAEIATVLLWFNPFVVLYKNSLKLQHEYLADASVLKDNRKTEGYLRCMLQRVQLVSSGGLTSHFYCKTIKKRIVMISKNKTSVKYLAMYLLVLPLICLLLFAFTSNKLKTSVSTVSMLTTNDTESTKPSIYPLNIKKVSKVADYGERIHPFTQKKDFHTGMDFAIAEGEKVYATAKGEVVQTDFDKRKGNFLVIKHDEVFSTFYSHLKSFSVKVGDAVEKGSVIGLSGNTGTYSTGSHLHYEIIKNGTHTNPTDYLPK